MSMDHYVSQKSVFIPLEDEAMSELFVTGSHLFICWVYHVSCCLQRHNRKDRSSNVGGVDAQ